MKRTLVVTMGVALALTLAACGGSNSSDSNTSSAPVASAAAPSPTTTLTRDELIADLRASGKANGAPQEQIDCVVDALSSLDAAQLQTLKDGNPDPATQEVETAASNKCIPSPSASPAAS